MFDQSTWRARLEHAVLAVVVCPPRTLRGLARDLRWIARRAWGR